MQIDGTLESQLILLRKVVRRLSTRDLCEEFYLIRISPLAREWGLSINEDEEVLGLPASPSLLASNVSFFILPALSFCVRRPGSGEQAGRRMGASTCCG